MIFLLYENIPSLLHWKIKLILTEPFELPIFCLIFLITNLLRGRGVFAKDEILQVVLDPSLVALAQDEGSGNEAFTRKTPRPLI